MHASIRYGLLTVLITGLGLGSRIGNGLLPDFISVHAGDALWACMIYFGFRTLFPKSGIFFSGCLSLLFCIAIECSQLYRANWINEIRNTVIGGLILGKGFLWMDLIRYTAGILLSVICDRFLIRSNWKSSR